MTTPKLLARQHDDVIENNDIADKRVMQPRADTTEATSVSEIFTGGAGGTVHVAMFESKDDEDRGGFVLRLRIASDGQAFVPYAVNIDDGIDIHVAGATEAKKVLAALRTVIA